VKVKIKPCTTVGNAWMVVKVSRFGKESKVAIGLTEHEAKSLKKKYETNT